MLPKESVNNETFAKNVTGSMQKRFGLLVLMMREGDSKRMPDPRKDRNLLIFTGEFIQRSFLSNSRQKHIPKVYPQFQGNPRDDIIQFLLSITKRLKNQLDCGEDFGKVGNDHAFSGLNVRGAAAVVPSRRALLQHLCVFLVSDGL
jgi:hypothetical protein